MGLYAIPLRDADVDRIVPVLTESGYRIVLERENDDARYFVCEADKEPLHFWITKRSPPRFCIGVGKRGTALVQVLSQHQLFDNTFFEDT